MLSQRSSLVNMAVRNLVDKETMLELHERVREERAYLDKLHEMLSNSNKTVIR